MDPFISEIRIFGFDWAPRGWAKCDGSILPVQQNAALFALLGVHFGGNGSTTFALPDLRGRVPVHQGVSARNSSTYQTSPIGKSGGIEAVSLTLSQMPSHSHEISASSLPGSEKLLFANMIAAGLNKKNGQPSDVYAAFDSTKQTTLAADVIGSSGTNVPHQNCQPSLVVNYCIAVQGIFPARN